MTQTIQLDKKKEKQITIEEERCDVQHFGPHMTIDISKCDVEKLKDMKLVWEVLDQLPEVIGMHKIMPPYVIEYPGPNNIPEDWGVSGFVMIAESHISIHTFPEKEYCFIDLFSCKRFDTDKAREFLLDAFDAVKAEVKTVKRGIDFPR